ncbi:MAG: 4Fe-4S binding protein [Euryarchaeota archaeon]|nr:4Fe-4S binding protein [Euryarchaeota archaeon]
MIVDNNVCLHCGACIGICPPNAMFLYETSTIVFLPHCTECGLCAQVCPVGAIDGTPGEPTPPALRKAGAAAVSGSGNGNGNGHGVEAAP